MAGKAQTAGICFTVASLLFIYSGSLLIFCLLFPLLSTSSLFFPPLSVYRSLPFSPFCCVTSLISCGLVNNLQHVMYGCFTEICWIFDQEPESPKPSVSLSSLLYTVSFFFIYIYSASAFGVTVSLKWAFLSLVSCFSCRLQAGPFVLLTAWFVC